MILRGGKLSPHRQELKHSDRHLREGVRVFAHRLVEAFRDFEETFWGTQAGRDGEAFLRSRVIGDIVVM